MKRLFALVCSLVLVFSTAGLLAAKTRAAGNVIDVGPGGSIAAAVSGASDGDTVRVAAGTYTEVNTIFPTVSNLTIEGAGAETTIIENNTTNVFSLGGDNEVRNLTIKGFTINENSGGYGLGCDMTTGHALGTLYDNIIDANKVGAGVFLGNLCSFELHDNQITNGILGVMVVTSNTETNIIHDNTISGFQLAVFAASEAAGLVTNNIYHNKITDNVSGVFLSTTTASIYNNSIYGNNATGGFATLMSTASLVQIYGNQIYQNTAPMGAGIFLIGSAAGSNVYNNYISQNTTNAGPGGGILSLLDSNPIFNNTIVNNTATADIEPGSIGQLEINVDDPDLQKKIDDAVQSVRESIIKVSGDVNVAASDGLGGGVYVNEQEQAPPSFYNNIVYGNVGDNISDVEGTMSVTYSDVEGGYTGTGNISGDPRLTDGYVLDENSPCLDAGRSTGAPSDDIDGTARPQRSGIDIGAYELPAPVEAEATATAAPETLPETGATSNSQNFFLALIIISVAGLIYTFASGELGKSK